jgi:hypothetical protein
MVRSHLARTLILCGVLLAANTAHADTLCDSSIVNRGVAQWQTGRALFDCLGTGASIPGPITIPSQSSSYRVKVLWGGYDASNGTPQGDIQLLVGVDNPRHTTARHKPEPGDSEATWRWDGSTEIVVPAGEPRKFSVWHNTSNGNAGNTYLRIVFLSSN